MELFFYSKQSDNLLFTRRRNINIVCHAGLHAVGLRWTLSRNLFHQPFLHGIGAPTPGNSFDISIAGARLHPGFYDLRVWLNDGDPNEVDGICTFGYRVDQLPVRLSRPADFSQFWQHGLAELAKIPLTPEEGPCQTFNQQQINAYNTAHASIPADYDPAGHHCENVEACKVNFAGINGVRIHGWLARPAGPGPFPAMLVLPGAGFCSRPMPLEHARHGYLALDIQVHGQDVDQPAYPDISGYNEHQVFAPIDKYYYYAVYLNCVQAVNYLLSRPDVDPRRVVVIGGSQGGRLSLVVAALDRHIAAAVPAIAHFTNQPYMEWAKAANEATPPRDGMDAEMPPPLQDTAENRCLAYYDPMNFAPDITCPVMMNCGLVDFVSPPACVFAAYHALQSGDKQIVPLPGLSHDRSAEFDRRAWRWLDSHLNITRQSLRASPPRESNPSSLVIVLVLVLVIGITIAIIFDYDLSDSIHRCCMLKVDFGTDSIHFFGGNDVYENSYAMCFLPGAAQHCCAAGLYPGSATNTSRRVRPLYGLLCHLWRKYRGLSAGDSRGAGGGNRWVCFE